MFKGLIIHCANLKKKRHFSVSVAENFCPARGTPVFSGRIILEPLTGLEDHVLSAYSIQFPAYFVLILYVRS